MKKQDTFMSPDISQFKHLSYMNCSVRFSKSALPSIRAKQKNRQSRTTCSYFCTREIKNSNGLACNLDKTEEDHLCSCFQSITLPGID